MEGALRFVFFNERGLRAGWRLAIFLFMIGATLVATTHLLKAVGASARPPADARQAGFLLPLSQGAVELLLFLPILFFSWVMSRIERRSAGEYGLPLKQGAFSRFAAGYFFWGFVPLSILLLALRLMHVFYFGNLSLHGGQILLWAAAWGFVFLMVGLFEEFLFRGYALFTLADGLGFWPAAVILAVFFARAHMGNLGETRVGIVATGLFALFAAATLWRTGDLWLAVGAHAGWDWGQSFFYGVSDSGLQVPGHLLNPHVRSGVPDWLSGGSVGPEGSVLTLILWGLMFLLFLVIYRKRKAPALTVTIAAPTGTPAA